MGSINKKNGRLFLDFRYRGIRCREYTKLDDNAANKKRLKTVLERIEAEITLGTFEYQRYFPNSKRAPKFKNQDSLIFETQSDKPLFRKFTEQWVSEKEAEWRNSYKKNMQQTIDQHLLPTFGDVLVDKITKADILAFRAKLKKPSPDKKNPPGPSRINHIMTPLRMILVEAADRYEFVCPFVNIKPLKVPKSDVQPFNLDEVQLILETVRADFKSYYTVRFFAGLRTAEIDGLMWKYIDFERRQILIRETIVMGKKEYTKNDGSYRTVDMNSLVYDALKDQEKATGKNDYVFCNSVGNPLYHGDISKKVWHPLLRHLGLKKRSAYQSRHTAATLWLASGEAPEWIARQMGHTTTEMLFTTYSRFVPNLTRRDGSAFDQLLKEQFNNENNNSDDNQ